MFVSFIITITLLLASCKKDELTRVDCNRLKKGLLAEDVKMVSFALRHQLGSYSGQNINKLSESLSGRCNISVADVCFDCVHTYPAQTEIRVSIQQSGTLIKKVIDISPTDADRMRIVNIHH